MFDKYPAGVYSVEEKIPLGGIAEKEDAGENGRKWLLLSN